MDLELRHQDCDGSRSVFRLCQLSRLTSAPRSLISEQRHSCLRLEDEVGSCYTFGIRVLPGSPAELSLSKWVEIYQHTGVTRCHHCRWHLESCYPNECTARTRGWSFIVMATLMTEFCREPLWSLVISGDILTRTLFHRFYDALRKETCVMWFLKLQCSGESTVSTSCGFEK